jgi:hypothetical protein
VVQYIRSEYDDSCFVKKGRSHPVGLDYKPKPCLSSADNSKRRICWPCPTILLPLGGRKNSNQMYSKSISAEVIRVAPITGGSFSLHGRPQ